MRLYKIETLVIQMDPEMGEIVNMKALIIPEDHLGYYDFEEAYFVGELAEAFEIIEIEEKNDDADNKEKTTVIPFKRD